MDREKLTELGFPYAQNVILLFEGGSKMHGAKLDGKDDTDWFGVYIEPPEKVLGVDGFEHFVYTTGGERGGNGPEDVDVCLYSLQKWARLACKGNPSVLSFLFAKPVFEQIVWAKLMMNAQAFLAKSHLGQFLGYANAQLRRLYNQQGQKNCNRPFLEEEFGYDTKYAMHIIRLLGEAKELMETGRMTFPRPNKDELIAIRKGEFKRYEFENWGNRLEQEALEAQKTSTLPDKVDRAQVSKLVAGTYRDFWSNSWKGW